MNSLFTNMGSLIDPLNKKTMAEIIAEIKKLSSPPIKTLPPTRNPFGGIKSGSLSIISTKSFNPSYIYFDMEAHMNNPYYSAQYQPVTLSLEFTANVCVTQTVRFYPTDKFNNVEALTQALEEGTILPSLEYSVNEGGAINVDHEGHTLLTILNTSTEGEYYDFGAATVST